MSSLALCSPNLKQELATRIRAELDLRKRRRELTEACTRSFRRFIQEAWPVVEPSKAYLPNWHIDAIADHLQAVTEGQIKNLLVNIPPGHAKSLLVSVLWPAWVWVRDPQWRSLFASYAVTLAIRDSVRCRSLIDSEWYQQTFNPDWGFSADQNQKAYYQNTVTGFRYSLGVGGSGTGWRGNLVAVDDPLNAKDQYSDAAIHECVFWWDQVMSSRLNDLATGNKVIIMQRLSERDLSGHVLEVGGYEHLCLPTEFEPNRRAATSIGFQDPRTEEGELLFPALFSKEVIGDVKRTLGNQGFAGQHQQRPAPAEGAMMKRHWWNFWKPKSVDLPNVSVRLPDSSYHSVTPIDLPEGLSLTQSWDMTFKSTSDSDFVVGQIWGNRGANYFLIDQVRGRWDFPETVRQFRKLTEKHPRATTKLVEDKANGSAVISTLKHDISGIIAVNPEGGKQARAAAISPLIEAGNVYLPHPVVAPWVQDLIEETASFPHASHDDMVDSLTQALIRLSTKQVWIKVV
jgi:predicted phage terminase large subunit-like protein